MNKVNCFTFFLLNMSMVIPSPVSLPNGGTGIVTATAYAVLCGGTTSTGPVQSLASAGTSGQALVSNGAGALPSFATLGFAGGGTGATSLSSGVIQSNGSVLSSLGVGSASQVLFNSAGTVGWSFTGILQVVSTSTSASVDTSGGSAIPDDDTIPQNTEGTEILTLAITPISSSSSLWIMFTGGGTPSASTSTIVALFVDSTANALAAQYVNTSSASRVSSAVLDFIVASSSTSARTYKIRIGGGGYKVNNIGSGQAFNGTASTTLTIIEFV